MEESRAPIIILDPADRLAWRVCGQIASMRMECSSHDWIETAFSVFLHRETWNRVKRFLRDAEACKLQRFTRGLRCKVIRLRSVVASSLRFTNSVIFPVVARR